MGQRDAINNQCKSLLLSIKWYQQFGTLNLYAQSFGNLIPLIGYDCWVTQDKMKQSIYKCTKYTLKYEAITSECLVFLRKRIKSISFLIIFQTIPWPGKINCFFYNFWLIKNKNNKINKTITVSATLPPQKLRLANQTAVTVGGSK